MYYLKVILKLKKILFNKKNFTDVHNEDLYSEFLLWIFEKEINLYGDENFLEKYEEFYKNFWYEIRKEVSQRTLGVELDRGVYSNILSKMIDIEDETREELNDNHQQELYSRLNDLLIGNEMIKAHDNQIRTLHSMFGAEHLSPYHHFANVGK